MPVDLPFDVYREHLSSLSSGHALWNPSSPVSTSVSTYDHVSIGDVGFIRSGTFHRMFNVIRPWDDDSNRKFGVPHHYEPLNFDDLTIRRETFHTIDYYSSSVSREEKANSVLAGSPEPPADGVTYRCRGRGALLSLPNGGHRENVIRTKAFEDYIRDHADRWFNWARYHRLGVERMEDLVLVLGCTLVTSWAAAAFVDHTINAEISLESRTLSNGGTHFVWSNVRGPAVHHNSRFDPQNPPTTPDQCVFIRGLRAKRVLFFTKRLRAAAEHHPDDPDDPDNRRNDETQMIQVSGVPEYRDPLYEVLDYIEKYDQDTIAEENKGMTKIERTLTLSSASRSTPLVVLGSKSHQDQEAGRRRVRRRYGGETRERAVGTKNVKGVGRAAPSTPTNIHIRAYTQTTHSKHLHPCGLKERKAQIAPLTPTTLTHSISGPYQHNFELPLLLHRIIYACWFK